MTTLEGKGYWTCLYFTVVWSSAAGNFLKIKTSVPKYRLCTGYLLFPKSLNHMYSFKSSISQLTSYSENIQTWQRVTFHPTLVKHLKNYINSLFYQWFCHLFILSPAVFKFPKNGIKVQNPLHKSLNAIQEVLSTTICLQSQDVFTELVCTKLKKNKQQKLKAKELMIPKIFHTS